MRILITGGAGFVGSSIALFLRRNYPTYKVVVLDNLKRRGSELNLIDLLENGIEFIHGDIRNQEDFDQIGGFDVMIEASAEPSVLAGLNNSPSGVINNNLFGSINCFNTCVKHKARVIFLSTSRIYPIARIENAAFTEEETRFNFANQQTEAGISKQGVSEQLSLDGARSFYGSTKLASELFLREYEQFYGLDAAITRFGVIAGPRQMGKTDQGIVTLWMAKHYWKQSLKYIGYGGKGKQVRDMLHVEDLISLVDMQIHQPAKFKNKVYNAGGGLENSASLMEMTQICEGITGNKINIDAELENRQADLKVFITDNSKIKEEIGWVPQKNINTIFEDVFVWIRQNEKKLEKILK